MQRSAIAAPFLSAGPGLSCAVKTLQWNVVGACVIVAITWIPGASGKPCSAKDAQAADAMIDRLVSWEMVERAYRQFGHCDDGSIAEGYSEAVARLLVDQWPTLPNLSMRIKRYPAFGRFVLRHIDATLSTQDVEKIAELASASCPPQDATLCARIRATASGIK